jgi:hypothetical protein
VVRRRAARPRPRVDRRHTKIVTRLTAPTTPIYGT